MKNIVKKIEEKINEKADLKQEIKIKDHIIYEYEWLLKNINEVLSANTYNNETWKVNKVKDLIEITTAIVENWKD